MYKLLTLMPTRGLIFTKAEMALEQELLANNQVPFILRTDNQPIPECRNTLMETALTIPDWTHVLLLDDDVIIPEGGLKKLLEADTDISFIDYPMHFTGDKWGGIGTATYDNWLPGQDWKDKPVLWAGLGCTLVKRELIEKMNKPYFQTTQRTFSRDDTGSVTLNDDNHQWMGGGEDTYFFLEARKLNASIKPIHGVYAGHARLIQTVTATQDDKYKKQHKVAINQEVKRPFK